MGHPYSEQARVAARIGDELLAKLLDRNDDGLEDAGVYDRIQASADDKIDARLRGVYEVPFDISLDPVIADISDHLVAAELLAQAHADSQDVRYHLNEANTYLNQILAKNFKLNAPLVSAANGRKAFRADYAEPVMAGRDANGVKRTSGW